MMKPYLYPLFLLSSIILGGLTGLFAPEILPYIKPIGTIFLNLILTSVVPLVFFCVASSITKFESQHAFVKTLTTSISLFIGLGLLAASYMLILVLLFPPGVSLSVPSLAAPTHPTIHPLDALPTLFTVSRFSLLFTNEHLLALLVFAILVGVAAKKTQSQHEFTHFLHAGEHVFLQVFQLIMTLAPVGFFAYFAGIVHELGPQLMKNYLHVTCLYYLGSLFYLVVCLSAYVYLAGGKKILRTYWKYLLLPAVTAIATCSSAASIPANYIALKKMKVPDQLAETMLPLGTILHKQGSIMGGVIKIAFLYSLFHLPFTGITTLVSAIGVSFLVGTVMGAIPSGGLLGELLILQVYGFDPNALFMIAAISILIDAPATLLNVIGNTAAIVMLKTRL